LYIHIRENRTKENDGTNKKRTFKPYNPVTDGLCFHTARGYTAGIFEGCDRENDDNNNEDNIDEKKEKIVHFFHIKIMILTNVKNGRILQLFIIWIMIEDQIIPKIPMVKKKHILIIIMIMIIIYIDYQNDKEKRMDYFKK